MTDEDTVIIRGIAEKVAKIYADSAHMSNVEFSTLISSLISVFLDHHVREEKWRAYVEKVGEVALNGAIRAKDLRSRLQ